MTAEILDKYARSITAAPGLVATLAWNTAIQNPFTRIFGEEEPALDGRFVYALIPS